MAVNIDVNAVYNGQGFNQAQQDASKTQQQIDRELKAQIRDRQRLLRLSASLERDITKEQRAQEKALKDQIAQRRRLNTLTEKLDREIKTEREQRNRRALGVTAGVVGAVGAVGRTAIELAREADQAQKTEQAFINLSGSIEKAAANQEAMRRATRGLASEQEQQEIANKVLGLQLVDNADQLETLISGARRLGKEFKGVGAADAADDFALLLTNMSYLRLDQFGLSAAKVRERVSELKDSGMGAEEAFRTAVFEEMEKTLKRLGPEVATTTEKLDAMAGKYADLRVNAGEFTGAFLEFTGLLDAGVSGLDGLNLGLEKANELFTALGDVDFTPDINFEKLGALAEGINKVKASPFEAAKRGIESLTEGKGLIESLRDGYQAYGDALTDVTNATIDLTTADEDLKKAAEEAAKGPDVTGAGLPPSGGDVDEEAQKRLEDEEKRLERVRDIRRNAAREILDIDKGAQKDLNNTWDKYFDDEADAWDKFQDTLAKDRKAFNKDIAKIDRDLAKDLKKLDRDTDKDIAKLKKDKERDDKNERRRQQIDALADERLFNFELRQLAADGEALAIQQALERRAIEEQIAKEKADVETQIEDEKLSDEISRRRQAADERRAELEADAAEARDLRKQELAEQVAEESQAYQDRIVQLREYRGEKLANIDESRQESINKLAEELAQSKDLTRDELNSINETAAKIGKQTGHDYASQFAAGLKEGLEKEDLVKRLTGSDYTGRTTGLTKAKGRPNDLASFAGGGFVDGPVGEPQLILAHGGEQVLTPEQQRRGGGININMPITIQGGGDEARIVAIVQRHQQALISDLEEMLN